MHRQPFRPPLGPPRVILRYMVDGSGCLYRRTSRVDRTSGDFGDVGSCGPRGLPIGPEIGRVGFSLRHAVLRCVVQ